MSVLVADDALERFERVVEACERVGLVVDEALSTIGVIAGSIAPGSADRLGAIDGVAAVEVQREVGIMPPEDEPPG